MANPFIPVLDPNRFVREFMSSPTLPPNGPAADGSMPTSNLFVLTRIEAYLQYIRFPIPVARSSHYDFFLITKGDLVGTDGLQTYRAGPHTVVLRAAGTITGVDTCAPQTEGFYCLFDAEYALYNLKNQNSLNELPFFGPDARPVVSLRPDECDDLHRQLLKIETEYHGNHPDRQRSISAWLYSFLLDLARIYANQTASDLGPARDALSSAGGLTARFKNGLKQHILSKRAVRDYADLLHVTPNHLNRCVKETTGRPASSWITDALMLEAKVLLRQTNLSIADIAFQLSIEDVSYFARLFKKHTGSSPTDYRFTSAENAGADSKVA